MKKLEAEWQTYKTLAVPEDAEKAQLTETRKAFYCGATAVFDLICSDKLTIEERIALTNEILVHKEAMSKGIV